jgi:hypothetical protein
MWYGVKVVRMLRWCVADCMFDSFILIEKGTLFRFNLDTIDGTFSSGVDSNFPLPSLRVHLPDDLLLQKARSRLERLHFLSPQHDDERVRIPGPLQVLPTN